MSFEKLVLLDKGQVMGRDPHHHRCSVTIGDQNQCEEGKDQIHRAKHAYPSKALQFEDRWVKKVDRRMPSEDTLLYLST